MLLCAACWSLVLRACAVECKCCAVYFLSIHFYSYSTLRFVWVWIKPVSNDEISYSWKFPEQSPSLKHIKGLPVWIMYGEQEREAGQRSVELITWWLKSVSPLWLCPTLDLTSYFYTTIWCLACFSIIIAYMFFYVCIQICAFLIKIITFLDCVFLLSTAMKWT